MEVSGNDEPVVPLGRKRSGNTDGDGKAGSGDGLIQGEYLLYFKQDWIK